MIESEVLVWRSGCENTIVLFSRSSPPPYALTAADRCHKYIFYKSLKQNIVSVFQEKLEMKQARRVFPSFKAN